VIVRLTGGLCNQLFMYAFGRSMSILRDEPVQYNWRRSTWDFALEPYGIEMEQALPDNLHKIYEEPGFGFDPNAVKQPVGTYFQGYWQSAKYFVDTEGIRKQFTLNSIRPPVKLMADLLRNQNSVFLHVRRGDYLRANTAAYHGNLEQTGLGSGYYQTAVDYIREKVNDPKFIVFSDDPAWCQRAFPFPVIHFSQHEDLYLMSNCKHGIGANSTFSWFANWLNENPAKVCIAPKQWFVNPEIDTSDLIPSDWIRL
jgi:hypothetical protein